MTATIMSMWFPILVLTVAGTLTLAVAWWATIVSEDHDEWLTGEDNHHG